MRGTLYIVAAPSGAGKSSIVNAVLARDPNISLSISFTSRKPRPGERHAEHYHFIDAEEFKAMVAAGDFFEHRDIVACHSVHGGHAGDNARGNGLFNRLHGQQTLGGGNRRA